MHLTASIRTVLLTALLAGAHVAFASHVTVHTNANVGNCDWCVCQGQTPAAPLPSMESVSFSQQPGPLFLPAEITPLGEPAFHCYQSRAPPSSIPA